MTCYDGLHLARWRLVPLPLVHDNMHHNVLIPVLAYVNESPCLLFR